MTEEIALECLKVKEIKSLLVTDVGFPVSWAFCPNHTLTCFSRSLCFFVRFKFAEFLFFCLFF